MYRSFENARCSAATAARSAVSADARSAPVRYFLRDAHRLRRGAHVALTAILLPPFLQLRRFLRLDFFVLHFAAEHEDELGTNHPLLDREIERRLGHGALRHRGLLPEQPLGLDDQHLLAERVARLLFRQRERVAGGGAELRDLDEEGVGRGAAVARPRVGRDGAVHEHVAFLQVEIRQRARGPALPIAGAAALQSSTESRPP